MAANIHRWVRLASLLVIGLAVGLGPAARADPSNDPSSGPPAPVEPKISATSGWPGDTITVDFPNPGGCAVFFDQRVDASPDPICYNQKTAVVTLTVPQAKPGQIQLLWRLGAQRLPQPVPFWVLPRFRVSADRAEGDPGQAVTVTFDSPDPSVEIYRCLIQLGGDESECGPERTTIAGGAMRRTATIRVPRSGRGPLHWKLWYTLPGLGPGVAVGRTPAGEPGQDEGDLPFAVNPPPPPPIFRVVADPSSAGPGEPVVVRFSTAVSSVHITGCSAGFETMSACGDSGQAALTVPSNALPTAVLPLRWTLSYTSERPGELAGTREGEIPFLVARLAAPRFAVSVQPQAARPGELVMATFTPLDARFSIVECLVAFPSAQGDVCGRSPQRWFAITTVPADARPGTTILRWGVGSRTAEGKPAADNGSVLYRVLPASSPTSQTSPTGPTSGPSHVQVSTTAGQGQQRFVAMTQPEAAAPRTPVTVTVLPVDPARPVTACVVAFANSAGAPCTRTATGWSARIAVPADAIPGTVPLTWQASSTGGGGGGTVDYRVLGDGIVIPAAFTVVPEPGSGHAGDRIIVSAHPSVDGVTLTGCRAGFTGQASAPCHTDGTWWTADLSVPAGMPAGPASLTWTMAYRQAGATPVPADGVTSFTVLAADPPGPRPPAWLRWLSTAAKLLGGGLVLALLVGWRTVRDWARRRAGGDSPGDVRVKPSGEPDWGRVITPDAKGPARFDVTIVRHQAKAGPPAVTEENR